MLLSDYEKYGSAQEKLRNVILNGKLSHAYIFEGDKSIDKLGFTKAFLKALCCNVSPGEGCDNCINCRKINDDNMEDIHIVSATGDEKKGTLSIKDKDVEELQRKLSLVASGKYNLGIINEAQGMTVRAQNRLLKTLEEPKGNSILVLITDNADTLLPTITSRCIKYRLTDFSSQKREDEKSLAIEILRLISEGEYFFNIKKKLDDEISNRNDALIFLDSLENLFGEYIRTDNVEFNRFWLIRAVGFVENKKNDIRKNVNFKYAIRQLVLELEEN